MKHTFLQSVILIGLFSMFYSCSDDASVNPTTINQPASSSNQQDWLVPTNQVFDGGPGKDGIPSIDNPQFQPVSEATFAGDWLVVGVKVGDELRAYPHYILDWHEIVNDDINGLKLALTYCPLTGTAIGWNRTLDGEETTFGVSGLLYNSNLMPYDRSSNSTWSQMRLDAVNGSLIGTEIQTEQLIETTFETWKAMFPESSVLTTETGFSRSYGFYPYGNYLTSNDLLFPVNNRNNMLFNKSRVLGLTANSNSYVYALEKFDDQLTEVIQDDLGGLKIVVVGNKTKNFIAGFKNELNGQEMEFAPVNNDNSQTIMEDQLGNEYNLFGEVVQGPNVGSKLEWIESSYIGFWFAWATFHPDVEIRNNN